MVRPPTEDDLEKYRQQAKLDRLEAAMRNDRRDAWTNMLGALAVGSIVIGAILAGAQLA